MNLKNNSSDFRKVKLKLAPSPIVSQKATQVLTQALSGLWMKNAALFPGPSLTPCPRAGLGSDGTSEVRRMAAHTALQASPNERALEIWVKVGDFRSRAGKYQ